MKKLLFFIPLIAFIALGVVFYQQLGKDTEYMPSALVGQPMPEFKLVDMASDSVVSNEAMPDEPYLLNFWATWCPSCSAEHAYLGELAEQGVNIVGIDYKDETPAAKQWLVERGNPYSLVLLDEMGKFGVDMGITGAPETFVVSATGEILYRHQGVVNEEVWQTLKEYMQ
ncbi:Thiol:disulfide interchange protein DsbE [Marinomonas gallaica]|uniref:Thiol:disulfide interchange protein DsbE n=1 Tax=Marinomonas gallaica TaxID=1806667 RepID=A0A1C3JMG4_9GAMM|nr:DsbE family thiol:disulfide interchange protein [Marinomonas gallaica]SBT16210.1 Thiol:disulfide interchange protein DsbE [Marinomonas gallaica]SBT21258.1 Thiol:disulfide interchange protein DsbE [Marinomonas gallaica]